MTLEELTGKSRPSTAPKTAKEVDSLIRQMLTNNSYSNDWEFVDELAVILCQIGEEALDPSKIVGKVGYQNSPLKPMWAIREGKEPFHVNDNITGHMVADPRVVYIGKFIAMVGRQSGHANEYMYELYVATAKLFHNYISPLGYAWSGNPDW